MINGSTFTICDIENGLVIEQMNQRVKMAALDILERQNVDKPRKVTLEISLSYKDGFVGIKAHSKISLPPDLAIKTICGLPDETGNLRRLGSPTNQATLPINFVVSE